MPELLVIFDGNALLHRAFHALPPLTTSRGELVNATYGFASMVFKVLNELKPRYAAVAFDKAAPTFRHLEFEAYKAHRPKAPEGLYEQMSRVKELVQLLNISIFEVEGFEADDVLGTLSRQAAERNVETVIASGDSDALQLVAPRIKVLTPGKVFSEVTLYDEAAVREKYGLEPRQLADFKGLKGDPSDNIPGVPGIGEKTAKRLLAQFGTVESMYERLDEVDEKTRKILSAHAEEAAQGKHLATIVTVVPVNLDLEKCRLGEYDRSRVVALLRELEFRSLLSRLPQVVEAAVAEEHPESRDVRSHVSTGPAPIIEETTEQMAMFGDLAPDRWPTGTLATTAVVGVVAAASAEALAPPCHSEIIDTAERFGEVLASIRQRSSLAIDVETTHKDSMRANLVGISLCLDPGQAYYIPVGHHEGLFRSEGQQRPQLPLDFVLEKLSPILRDAEIKKFAHNGKYDVTVLDRQGVHVEGLDFDTMVATYLVDPGRRVFNLKDVGFTKLGIEMAPIETLIGKGKAQITMAEVGIELAARYACLDAEVTFRLVGILERELKAAGLWKLFEDVEMPLVSVLAKMEQNGVALDVPHLRRLSDELHSRIVELERRICYEAGCTFNINSHQQLAKVLFQDLRLPSFRKTKTGLSTEAEVLEELRGKHPIVELVLDYRQLMKLKSTYVDALPLMINPITGRLHTSFNQTGTVTGRLSSSEPNLQNIPIRTELGRKIRGAFVAGDPDSVLLSADYSQIELRILAHITRDPRLLAAFAADEDVHAATASEIFGVSLEKVTPDQRRVAKVVNFGIIYGMSDYGLAAGAGLTRSDAGRYIENYLGRYEGVSRYIATTKQQASENGYVSTILGRRRYLPEINASNRVVRQAAERTAINMPIQGTAADIIKVAMIDLQRQLERSRLRTKMILQVHDELLFEVPKDELGIVQPMVVEAMEGSMSLDVPLKVDVKVGRSWLEMED